jgi:predicted dehydrogenase
MGLEARAGVRAGVIGIGWGGDVVVPALLANPDIEISAVCSGRLERARAFAQAMGIAVALDDADALVTRDDVDLVFVCTPASVHAEMSRAALAAGRHVFSTKPLAADVESARELSAFALEQGLVTAMDFVGRYDPVNRYLRYLVAEGYLGEIRFVSASVFWSLATDPAMRLYYWDWVSLRESSGGMLGASLGLHHLDLLRYVFGEVTDVGGFAATLITEKPVLAEESEWNRISRGAPTAGMRAVDAEDVFSVHGRFSAGGAFSITGSWSIHHGSGIRYEAYGSEGTLILDAGGRLSGGRAASSSLEELPVPKRFGDPAISGDRVARFGLLAADLVGAIRGETDAPLFATFQDGLRLKEITSPILAGAR